MKGWHNFFLFFTDAFCLVLSSMTGLRLHPLAENYDSENGDDSNAKDASEKDPSEKDASEKDVSEKDISERDDGIMDDENPNSTG